MLTAERLDAEGNQVSVMDVERLPIDPEQAIGKDNVESMDCFRVLERGADGVLRTEHGHQAVPNDPAAGEWNPPGSSWFIVTYQGPPPYKERKVLGQLRNPHFLEVVRIRGVDGKMRLGVIPEPPLGKDAVDE